MYLHCYTDVPGLGVVKLSNHAKERLENREVNEHEFLNTLWNGKDIPEGDTIWRTHKDLRIVIIPKPQPYRGAALIKTIVRVR